MKYFYSVSGIVTDYGTGRIYIQRHEVLSESTASVRLSFFMGPKTVRKTGKRKLAYATTAEAIAGYNRLKKGAVKHAKRNLAKQQALLDAVAALDANREITFSEDTKYLLP